MDRRYFLKQTAVSLPLLLICPEIFGQKQRTVSLKRKKILILIELSGGNDGLNTLIPYSQSNYYKLRPTLAIPKDKLILLPQKPGLGLHPELKNLAQLISNKQVAVLQSVGYPDPSLSHFRSMDIWHTGYPKEDLATEGWLKTLIVHKNQQAVSFSDNLGGFEGSPNNVFLIAGKNLTNKKKGKRRKKGTERRKNRKNISANLALSYKEIQKNKALAHILDIKRQIGVLDKVLKSNREINFDNIKPPSPFYKQIRTLLQIVSSDHPVSLFKIHLKSFDTHKNQLKQHSKLLKEMDQGIHLLTKHLKQLNLWDQTLILTYSEFGRRIRENRSEGTDHGTAGVHFAIGGLVRSGFYGQEPILETTQKNLPFYLDFRSLYAVILKEQFDISDTESQLVKNFYKPANSFLHSG